MGKRKRTPPDIPSPPPSCPPSDSMPCSSGMGMSPKEMSTHALENNEPKHLSFAAELMENFVGQQDKKSSLVDQRFNVNRSVFQKRPRHYFGQQYSRRNSANHTRASTSHGKNTSLRDEKLFLKLPSQHKPDYGQFEDVGQRAFWKPERIRSTSATAEGITNIGKTACGICDKLLRRKYFSFGDGSSVTDVSVVAVLVCGHVYHADCLELRTCHELKRDPPCPLCAGTLSKANAS